MTNMFLATVVCGGVATGLLWKLAALASLVTVGISLSPGLLSAVNINFKSAFMRGVGRVPPMYGQVAMVVPSTTEAEVYPFRGMFGTLREWIGPRIAEELTTYEFVIKNKSFEGTLRVPRPKIEDDQFGIYGVEAEALGDAAARHPDKLLFDLLESGWTGKCYDGQPFFSSSHPNYYNASTWGNLGTTAFSSTSYGVARAGMMALKDDAGESLDVNPDLLVVGPALDEAARQVLTSDWIVTSGTGGQNMWKGSARLLVVPRLTDANDWYLFDTSRVIKALIVQMRKAPVLTSKTNLSDDNVFVNNEFLWGVDYRGNVGYGLPQLAFGAHVT
jgi:phage major head subunit gpT-like protein